MSSIHSVPSAALVENRQARLKRPDKHPMTEQQLWHRYCHYAEMRHRAYQDWIADRSIECNYAYKRAVHQAEAAYWAWRTGGVKVESLDGDEEDE